MTYDEQLERLANKIIVGVLNNKNERLSVMSTFSRELFRNENFLIYSVLLDFKEQDIVPDGEFLSVYLNRNRDLILNNNNNIDTQLYDTDQDLVTEVIASTIKTLDKYKKVNVDEDYLEDLKLNKAEFKLKYKSSAVSDILENTNLILNGGLKIGKRVLNGPDDASEYFERNMTRIKSLIDEESKDLYYINEIELQDKQHSPELIGDFGDLQFLTEQFGGGIYTGMFYSVMAPTKGGKSKFCYRAMHNVAVIHHKNTLMWSFEGGEAKAKAELRAIHFVYYWENIMGKQLSSDMSLSANNILRGKYPNQTIQDMEEESNRDLENNEEYGSMAFIKSPLRIDTYINLLEKYIEEVHPHFIIVDYLQLMLPAERGTLSKLSKNERIGQAYVQTLSLIKEKNVAFMTPAQMKQDAIKELSAGKDFDTRTLGGESSEIVRTPDYNIALYGTPEDIHNGYMKLLSIPSREAEPFTERQIGVQLGFSYYYDTE